MALFASLRAVVYFRRGVRALERLADATESLARIAESDHKVKTTVRKPRPTEFFQMDTKAAEEIYERDRAEREAELS